ncbi:DUF5009 domain-containing protein [Siphonobacter curvatus]|uniref:DUF5009 domain-containing protein n=1 Tax=Siphonobacter curvatus TaxID=2094562 RepID=A0A2S7IFW4_9BACT|nr:DUF5009 domain-containing protein [Siphonobacter curvatus]PQA54396.1 hypothetical protein C5O19_21845 [Siphonobacter curvatus]
MKNSRIPSIDVFRGLTMLLMIFVNDLWTLRAIPSWLEHAEADVDFLGLADTVFPCFLFILGMSIPLGVDARLTKGESPVRISGHIVLRTLALLVMGIFTVNVPELNANLTGLSSAWFQILMVTAFFLIWNVYPKTFPSSTVRVLQGIGIVILLVLAVRFRGGTPENPQIFRPQWWGILGLIGWSYGVSALLYLGMKGKVGALAAAFLFFTLTTIAAHADWQVGGFDVKDIILGNGAFHAFTMAGLLTTLLLRKQDSIRGLSFLLGAGCLMLGAGFIAHAYFIISKIQATPTWVFFCTGIALLTYAVVYGLVEIGQKVHWFTWLKPAGIYTLTCYLLPYYFYSLAELTGRSLPDAVLTGGVGLLKSLAFAGLVLITAQLLSKINIRLKL